MVMTLKYEDEKVAKDREQPLLCCGKLLKTVNCFRILFGTYNFKTGIWNTRCAKIHRHNVSREDTRRYIGAQQFCIGSARRYHSSAQR